MAISKYFKPDEGGGGGMIKPFNKKNSYRNNIYMSDIVMAITRDDEIPQQKYIKVLKNRYGNTGRADPQQTIELCALMISMSVFGNKLKMFRVELEEAIKETIMKKIGGVHDPFRTESTGDGT